MSLAMWNMKETVDVPERNEINIISVFFADYCFNTDRLILSAFRNWLANSSEVVQIFKGVNEIKLSEKMEIAKRSICDKKSDQINFDTILAGNCAVKENGAPLDPLSYFLEFLSRRGEKYDASSSLLDLLLIEIILTDRTRKIFDVIAIFKKCGFVTGFMEFVLLPKNVTMNIIRAELIDSRSSYEAKLLYHLCKIIEKRQWANRPSSKRELLVLSRFIKLECVDPQTFLDYLESFISECKLDRNTPVNFLFSEIRLDCSSPAALCFFFHYNEILLDCVIWKFLGPFFDILCKLDSKISAVIMSNIESLADSQISFDSITNFRDGIASAAKSDSNKLRKRLSNLNWRYPFSYHGSFGNTEYGVNICSSESIILWANSMLETGGKIVELVPQNIAFEIFAWMFTCLPNTKEVNEITKNLAINLVGDKVSEVGYSGFRFLMPFKFLEVEAKDMLTILLDILSSKTMIGSLTSTFVKFCSTSLKKVKLYSVNIGNDQRVEDLIRKLFQQSVEIINFYGEYLLDLFFSKIFISDSVASKTFQMISGVLLNRLTDPQLIVTCHLLLQFPKLSTKIELGEITAKYTFSLSFMDKILKKLLQSMQEQGIDLGNILEISPEKSAILAANRSWYQICASQGNESTISNDPESPEFSAIDPEYLMNYINQLLNNDSSIDSAVKVEQFIATGKLGFLIMCLSEYTPDSFSTAAKFLIAKFSEKVELLQPPLKYVTRRCLETIKNGLKSEIDTLPYMVAYFFAEVFAFLTSSEAGFISQADLNKDEISLKSFKKKANKKKMSHREVVSKVFSASEMLLKLIMTSKLDVDCTQFPPKAFVDLVLGASENKHLTHVSEWLVNVVSTGAFGQSAYQILMKSGILSQFLILAGSQRSKSTSAFAKLVSCLCKTRSVLKNAIDIFQIDVTLFALMQNCSENDELMAATVMELIEAFIFDKNKYNPIEKALTSTKSLIFLKVYLETLSYDANLTVSDRNCVVIITLMLCIEDFSILETENNFVRSFLSKLSQSDWKSTSSKLLFYLKWTLDMILTSNIGLVSDAQKIVYTQNIKRLFRKMIY